MALTPYVGAIENAFGGEVDYAQIVKVYGTGDHSENRRYSAPYMIGTEKVVIVGNPDQRLISTSYVERLNATTRLHMRRLTRLTLAFSKKRENFRGGDRTSLRLLQLRQASQHGCGCHSELLECRRSTGGERVN
jgi:hypothetical protein